MNSRISLNGTIAIILLGVAFFCHSCYESEVEPVRIALSKGSPVESYSNYYNWLHEHDSTAIVLDMYNLPLDSALLLFNDCSGLLLTGGTDIEPGFYGKAGDRARCWPPDLKRDSLEFALFKAARKAKKPILGICRGEQLINVALGGSLIIDIPTDFDTVVKHECEDYLTCYHTVTVESHSMLHEISGVYAGEVTSNHHQGIDILASELNAVSYAPDGLVEAVEWAYPEGNPFLLAVQWHPERMDRGNPLSGPIAERFLEEARKYCRQNMTKDQE